MRTLNIVSVHRVLIQERVLVLALTRFHLPISALGYIGVWHSTSHCGVGGSPMAARTMPH